MSISTSYTADGTFNSTYTPSDSSSSFVNIEGTTLRIAQTGSPSGPTDTGTAGEIRLGDGHIYVCTDTNTWKRVAITTWTP